MVTGGRVHREKVLYSSWSSLVGEFGRMGKSSLSDRQWEPTITFQAMFMR